MIQGQFWSPNRAPLVTSPSAPKSSAAKPGTNHPDRCATPTHTRTPHDQRTAAAVRAATRILAITAKSRCEPNNANTHARASSDTAPDPTLQPRPVIQGPIRSPRRPPTSLDHQQVPARTKQREHTFAGASVDTAPDSAHHRRPMIKGPIRPPNRATFGTSPAQITQTAAPHPSTPVTHDPRTATAVRAATRILGSPPNPGANRTTPTHTQGHPVTPLRTAPSTADP